MYDMYPEWGPARHRHEDTEPMSAPTRRPRYWEAPAAEDEATEQRELVGAGVGGRDGDGDLPEDN